MLKFNGAIQAGRDYASAFFGWWGGELHALLPAGVKSALAGSGKRVELAVVDGGYRIRIAGNQRDEGHAYEELITSRAQAASAAAGIAAREGASGVTLVLPQTMCFLRTVEVPRSALKDCRRVLDLDLERATPFRRADVYTSYKVIGDTASDQKASVRQYVTKRDLVDPIIADVVKANGRVDAIDMAIGSSGTTVGINFIEATDGDRSGLRALTPTRALSLAAVVLLLLACGQLLYKREGALEEVREQSALLRTQATAVRQALEQSQVSIKDLAAVQALKMKQVPMIAVIEEITRILPDTAWVTDLRVENDIVDISGLAKSGANLLPLFERSPVFGEASLTAPLTFDQREDKERFSLRVRIKSVEVRGTGASG